MTGKIILLDPGHGGKDNGAYSEGVYEDEINLKIATFLYEKIISQDGVSYITRVDDYDLASLYAKNRKREDLKKRIEIINSSNCHLFISIHINALQNETVYGPMVYYRRNDEQSKALAESMQTQLNNSYKVDKKVIGEDYYLFKHTHVPGVLIECGFISNNEERSLLLQEKYQKEMAKNIYLGLNYYLNNGENIAK